MLNLAAFKKIASAAALAGLLAGLLLTGLQRIQVAPAILEAEMHEQGTAPQPSLAANRQPSAQHGHEHGHDHDHEHGHGGVPAHGLERTALTALANISMAVGFALLLGAGMSLRENSGRSGLRAGLLWGAAGYAVFFLAPSMGLPPELPGTEAASLTHRQLWWLLTVAATAAGLALLIFTRSWALRIAGVVMLCIPHLLGAPQPAVHSSTAPAELTHSFILATAIANAVFWLALGGLTGIFYRKSA